MPTPRHWLKAHRYLIFEIAIPGLWQTEWALVAAAFAGPAKHSNARFPIPEEFPDRHAQVRFENGSPGGLLSASPLSKKRWDPEPDDSQNNRRRSRRSNENHCSHWFRWLPTTGQVRVRVRTQS